MSPEEKEVSEDLLSDLDNALQDPAEGARKAGEKLDEKPVEDDDTVEDDDNDNEDEETEDESVEDDDDDGDLDLKSKHDFLKSEIGRQANELGSLRKKLKELETAKEPKEPVVNPLDAKLAAARKTYGDEVIDLIEEIAESKVQPIKQSQGIQALRDRYKDFDDVRGSMDEIFASSPSLREAAAHDMSVLDTVYVAAKAKQGGASSSEQTQKDGARHKAVDKAKKDAYVEKPSVKADVQRKVTEKEKQAGFIDHLISSLRMRSLLLKR